MLVTFYTFSKRKNSTKVPNVAGTTLSCQINDANTSILNPSIRIAIPSDSILACNYIMIPKFNRYYYINNWEYNADGTWTALCTVDPLASWKSHIIASGGYVGRCGQDNGSHWDKNVLDTFYPVSNISIVQRVSVLTGLTHTIKTASGGSVIEAGTFLLGVIGTNTTPTVGSVAYYAMSVEEMAKLVTKLATVTNSDWTLSDMANNYSDMIKSIVNPMQYIVSCKWFPFVIPSSALNQTLDPVYIWGWNSTAVGKKLKTTDTSVYVPQAGSNLRKINIPDVTDFSRGQYFPDSNIQAANYPPYAPYAEYDLITPWGTFDIDSSLVSQVLVNGPAGVSDYKAIYFSILANLIDGSGSLKVFIPALDNTQASNPTTELFRVQINLGLDINLSQVTRDYITYMKAEQTKSYNVGRSVGAGLQMFGDMLTGGLTTYGLGSISAGGRGIENIMSTNERVAFATIDAAYARNSPVAQSTGSTNAAYTIDIDYLYLQVKRYRTVNQDIPEFGKPVKKHEASLVSYSGYVQMDNSNFDAPCTINEKNIIIDYLTGGLFIE